jgi:hypothetical protein
MCTIDWTALGTCVQAFFVAGGTILGIWQFTVFTRNQRISNTLKLLDDHEIIRRGTDNLEMTPAQAWALVNAAPRVLAIYTAARKAYIENGVEDNQRTYMRFNNALVIILNYYSQAARLAERRLIDIGLFFESQAFLMTEVLPNARKFIEIEKWRYDLRDLRAFEQRASEWLKKHPVLLPTESEVKPVPEP